MCNHDIYYVNEVKGKTIPLDSLMKGVAATLPDSVQITGVTISDNPKRTYQVSLSKPRRASLFVDQYNGKITGTYERGAFFKNMFFLSSLAPRRWKSKGRRHISRQAHCWHINFDFCNRTHHRHSDLAIPRPQSL